MEIWRLFKSQNHSEKNKGQVSFEFIIVLAVAGILSSTILADFYYESNDTFILSATKSIALREVYKVNSEFNSECYLKSISIVKMIQEETVQIDIEGNSAECSTITASLIADGVEKDYCGITPNSDDSIDCAEGYQLKVV